MFFNDFEQITLGSLDDSPLEPLIIDLAEIHHFIINYRISKLFICTVQTFKESVADLFIYKYNEHAKRTSMYSIKE